MGECVESKDQSLPEFQGVRPRDPYRTASLLQAGMGSVLPILQHRWALRKYLLNKTVITLAENISPVFFSSGYKYALKSSLLLALGWFEQCG